MSKAVSPIIGTMIVFLLVTFSIGVTMLVIQPAINRVIDSSKIQEGINNLEFINSLINEVSSEAEGSRRVVPISISEGEIIFNNLSNTIHFYYSRKSDLTLFGKSGNVFIDSGEIIFEDYFNTNKSWICKGICVLENNMFKVKGLAYYPLNKNISKFQLEGSISGNGKIFPLNNPDSLVLYLPMDEGSGNYTYDYSGNNNNGTLYNGSSVCSGLDCPTWVDGKFDKAISFDGMNDYVEIQDSSSLNTPILTVCSWVRLNSHSPNYQSILNKGDGSSIRYQLRLQPSSNKFEFSVENGSSYTILSSSTLASLNTWYFVCASANNDTVKIYVNGNLENSTSQVAPITSIARPLVIGMRDDNSQWFNGTIDEVRIYNRALSEEEIKFLYEEGSKKLDKTGIIEVNSNIPNASIVLSSPKDFSHFDSIKVRKESKATKLTIPLEKAILTKTLRLSKGNYNLLIEKVGIDTTTRKSIIKVEII